VRLDAAAVALDPADFPAIAAAFVLRKQHFKTSCFLFKTT
jgi:hypothetical protein